MTAPMKRLSYIKTFLYFGYLHEHSRSRPDRWGMQSAQRLNGAPRGGNRTPANVGRTWLWRYCRGSRERAFFPVIAGAPPRARPVSYGLPKLNIGKPVHTGECRGVERPHRNHAAKMH